MTHLSGDLVVEIWRGDPKTQRGLLHVWICRSTNNDVILKVTSVLFYYWKKNPFTGKQEEMFIMMSSLIYDDMFFF